MGDYEKVMAELNSLPEFFHKGHLCVEWKGNIYRKSALAKTALLLFGMK